VDALPDLETMDDAELERLIRELELEEDGISRRRRVLHGRIDILRAERVARLTAQVAEGEVDLPAPDTLERPIFQGTGELPAEGELEAMPDLATLPDERLRALILALEREEDDVSLERRVLQGRVDILRAEQSRRRGDEGDPDGLAGVLSGGPHDGA
jgi:hypothetical protein